MDESWNSLLHLSLLIICDPFRTEESEDPKGIPEFWLTIFKNVGTLADMVQAHDEPILKHLQDIQVKYLEANPMVSCIYNLKKVLNCKNSCFTMCTQS